MLIKRIPLEFINASFNFFKVYLYVAKLVTDNLFPDDVIQIVSNEYGVSKDIIKTFVLDMAKKITSVDENSAAPGFIKAYFEEEKGVTATRNNEYIKVFFDRILELFKIPILFGYQDVFPPIENVKVEFTKNDRIVVSLRYPKPPEGYPNLELDDIPTQPGSDVPYPELEEDVPEPENDQGNDNSGDDNQDDDPEPDNGDDDENDDGNEDDNEDENEDDNPPTST